MKKEIFLLLLIVACNQKPKEELINQKIKEYMIKNANDPESYEPIETISKDTIYLKKEIEFGIYILKPEIEDDEKTLKQNPDMVDYLLPRIKESKTKLEVLFRRQDSLIKSKNPNPILYYVFTHKCRGKNAMGAKVITNYRIKTDSNINILSIVAID